MSTEPESLVDRLLSRSARLTLYVAWRKTLDSQLLRKQLKAHLIWMIEMEKQGRVFLSGPISPRNGAPILNGLTLVRAQSTADAEELLRKDPAIECGAVEADIFEWTVYEGGIRLMLTLSDSAVIVFP